MTNLIRETIVCTENTDGTTHIAPLGVHAITDKQLLILPFRPSRSLDNLSRTGMAVINYTDDVRIFAGCLTGRRDWPLQDCDNTPIQRLSNALAHAEVKVIDVSEDEVRPRYACEVVHEKTHRPFHGFNRAQAAIIELAITASRLHMLPAEEVRSSLARLRIPFEKTAGENERIAWQWLSEKIERHNKQK